VGSSRKAGSVAVAVTTVDESIEPRVSKPHVSFSQLSMYLRCSMQYYFRYILGLKEPPKLPLAIGKGGHSALEYNGRYKLKNGVDLAVPDMLDMASTFIDIESEEVEAPEREKGEAKDRAIASLRVYQTRDAAAITPAGVEVEFNLDLNDGLDENVEPIRIVNGKIDIITTDAAVTDYKFVGQARSQGEVDLSPQLTLYGKVFQTLTGKYPQRTGYQMFLPGSTRTPPDSRAIYRDPALMAPKKQEARFQRLRFQFQQVEKGIRTGMFMPTDDPKVCSWCGYRDRCQSSLVNDFEAARLRGDH
jgi:RecB family exonuclease